MYALQIFGAGVFVLFPEDLQNLNNATYKTN